jgi:hypothetical protein
VDQSFSLIVGRGIGNASGWGTLSIYFHSSSSSSSQHMMKKEGSLIKTQDSHVVSNPNFSFTRDAAKLKHSVHETYPHEEIRVCKGPFYTKAFAKGGSSSLLHGRHSCDQT